MRHTRLALTLTLLMTLPPALAAALEINNFDPAVHRRFASGWAAAPATNSSPNFLGAGFDWSGVGWNTASPAQGITLIAPQWAVGARHASTPVGQQVAFLGNDGAIYTSTVERHYSTMDIYPGQVNSTAGATYDLRLFRLSDPLPTDKVTFYPVLHLDDDEAYKNRDLLLYGQSPAGQGGGPAIGYNQIDRIEKVAVGIVPQPDDRLRPRLTQIKAPITNLGPNYARGASGDSASPMFSPYDNHLALIGTWWFTEAGTFAPHYRHQLNAYMLAFGDRVSTVGAAAADPHAMNLARYDGDYVQANVDLPGRNGVLAVINAGGDPGISDRRLRSAFNPDVPLSPAAGYTGPAFYGAMETIAYDSTTTATSHYSVNILNGTPTDTLNIQLRPDAAGSAGQSRTFVFFNPRELTGLASNAPPIAANSATSLAVRITNHDHTGFRWLIRDGDQFYLSEVAFTGTGTFALAGGAFELMRWAAYDPLADLDFDQDAAAYAVRTFSDITGAGLYTESDFIAANTSTPSSTIRRLWISEFAFNGAAVPEPNIFIVSALVLAAASRRPTSPHRQPRGSADPIGG